MPQAAELAGKYIHAHNILVDIRAKQIWEDFMQSHGKALIQTLSLLKSTMGREASAVVGVVNSVNDPDTVLKDFIHKHITRPALANDAMPEQDPVFKLAGVALIMRRVWISVINSLRQLCIKLKVRRNLLKGESSMTARGTPDRAPTSFRNARILWAGHNESRKTVEQQITSLSLPQKTSRLCPTARITAGTSGCAEMAKLTVLRANAFTRSIY